MKVGWGEQNDTSHGTDVKMSQLKKVWMGGWAMKFSTRGAGCQWMSAEPSGSPMGDEVYFGDLDTVTIWSKNQFDQYYLVSETNAQNVLEWTERYDISILILPVLKVSTRTNEPRERLKPWGKQ